MHVKLFSCLGLLALCGGAHAASTSSPQLRIGLDKYFAHATTLLVSSEAPFTLRDTVSGKSLAHGDAKTIYRVVPTADGLTMTREELDMQPVGVGNADPITVAAGEGSSVKIERLDNSGVGKLAARWHQYRGTITITREADQTLQVIDTVPLEQYLYGVIPAEIGSDVPLEAMKAQAVAARTYALKNRGKFASEGYDMDDTTRCEGYFGIDGETPLSNAAVDATRGQVMTYESQLIDAPYSTDSGGMTACDTSGECPYLQAVLDAPSKNGPDYACGGKYHTWSKTFALADLTQLLARDPRTAVGQFVSLAIDGVDASGRITTVTVSGADGTMKTVTGPQLRQILGYDVLRSTRVTMTVLPDGSYQFDGKGWGHGLGMSQDGAVAMASVPYKRSYKEILSHYYVGAEIKHIGQIKTLDLATAPPAF